MGMGFPMGMRNDFSTWEFPYGTSHGIPMWETHGNSHGKSRGNGNGNFFPTATLIYKHGIKVHISDVKISISHHIIAATGHFKHYFANFLSCFKPTSKCY